MSEYAKDTQQERLEQERLEAVRLNQQYSRVPLNPDAPPKPVAPALSQEQQRVKNVVDGLDRLLIDAQLGTDMKRSYSEALVELRLALREAGCAVD